ncbi:S9 family peptidase [Paeniglutamicibacter gangotriensis]|uniref:Peptidase S9 prolyl oligopeptidase active site domain-containing protein n=1 Tax=Paeniglutamicibacter gangotriensis Lz1y TaxID=1276920 RepID=M7N6Y6_9MICC|nr:S9 family peptidase [Paeniglutamicibacter gangotriensis]EMQ97534.1 peptidase S9 prolyl oligopeptidase active site domain-containing protein [Paeniglutamicibacter gangotriensis Lz1y]
MKPEQLDLLTTVSAPSVAPDASAAAVSASRPSFESDTYVGQLWLLGLGDTDSPRRLTRGESDHSPQYSPDGQWIAFLRTDADGRGQLAVVEALGGEPRLLTNRQLGVTGFVWAPDSTELAFTSRTAETGRYGSIKDVGTTAEAPRRISTLKYRADGVGFFRDKVQGLFTLPVPALGAEPFVKPRGRAAHEVRELPTGLPESARRAETTSDVSDPCYSPDGKWIYFTAALHEEADTDLRSHIHRVPRAGTAPATPEWVLGVAHGEWAYRAPQFSTDGATLFVLGQQLGSSGVDFLARHVAVCAVAADQVGIPEARVLSDMDAFDYTECEILVPHGADGVLATARVRGTGELHLVTADGTHTVLGSGGQNIHGAASADGHVVISYESARSPGECGRLEGGAIVQLTDFAAPLHQGTNLSAPREVEFTAPDGYPVHGWIHLPQGAGPHPVLLNIHGGPFAQYGPAYFDEAQVYAEAGYAVLQCNPRGSASYGREHGLAIKHAMGTVDMADVLAFLQGACAAEPVLDAQRTGILGGSYGGYLTAWTIAHEHRFAAAMVERGFLDSLSFVGTSDIGWFFAEAYTGSDPEQVAAQSPMAKIGQVQTPTLVMHSEGDYRCPLEQAQRYYVGLKQRQVPTELVLFPGESHGLSRGGSPWHRRQRFEAILDWFNKYLPAKTPEAQQEA